MRIFSARCTSTTRLDGKTAIVTGSNTGIGKMTVLDFYKRGARVIMACRDTEKAKAALEDIKKMCEKEKNLGEIFIKKLDLGSLDSVRNCAEDILQTENHINILVNNAGVMLCSKEKTEDGFELQFGTNHLGHFLFTLLLLPSITKSTPARIINVSSSAHFSGQIDFEDLHFDKKPYKSMDAYSQSKLANVLFTKQLALKLKEKHIEGVTVYSLHPGVIATDLGRHLDKTYFRGFTWLVKNVFSIFMKSPEQGAQTTIHCAVDEKAGNETGLYYAECEVSQDSPKANNMEDAKRLWEISLELVHLDKDNNILA